MDKRSYMSGEEKMFLKELVTQYQSVIENKKTDCISAAEKKKAWVAIAEQFNGVAEHSSRNFQRSVEQLRKCWENLKSRRKKELAEEKKQRMATGGGSYKPPIENDVTDDILKVVDIEIPDVIDSDTKPTPQPMELVEGVYELDDDYLLCPIQSSSHDEPPVSTSGTSHLKNVVIDTNSFEDSANQRNGHPITPNKKKNWYTSRSRAVEAELDVRVKRIHQLMKQEAEVHALVLKEKQLKVEEQEIRLQIAKAELNKFKTNCICPNNV